MAIIKRLAIENVNLDDKREMDALVDQMFNTGLARVKAEGDELRWKGILDQEGNADVKFMPALIQFLGYNPLPHAQEWGDPLVRSGLLWLVGNVTSQRATWCVRGANAALPDRCRSDVVAGRRSDRIVRNLGSKQGFGDQLPLAAGPVTFPQCPRLCHDSTDSRRTCTRHLTRNRRFTYPVHGTTLVRT